MTDRERILTAFRHEIPDYTPADGWFHGETIKNLKEYYGTDDWSVIAHDLGVDGWATIEPSVLYDKKFDETAEMRSYKGMTKHGVWRDERTYSDALGIVSRIGEAGWYEEWVSGPLVSTDGEDLSAIDSFYFPSVNDIIVADDYAEKIQAAKDDGKLVRAGVANPYKTAWQLRGMDNVLMDYLVNRPFLEALDDRIYAQYTERMVRAVRAGVDMIVMIGDVAMQDRIIMGPDTWREVDKPRMAKFVAACRAENPDVHMFIHSDGNIMDIMDDIVEIGFDVVNPIQPECMSPIEVKKRWGDKITLHGGISLQEALIKGTEDDIRAEVNELIDTCGRDGGLVMFPSNVIQPDTSPENVVACYHAAKDFKLR